MAEMLSRRDIQSYLSAVRRPDTPDGRPFRLQIPHPFPPEVAPSLVRYAGILIASSSTLSRVSSARSRIIEWCNTWRNEVDIPSLPVAERTQRLKTAACKLPYILIQIRTNSAITVLRVVDLDPATQQWKDAVIHLFGDSASFWDLPREEVDVRSETVHTIPHVAPPYPPTAVPPVSDPELSSTPVLPPSRTFLRSPPSLETAQRQITEQLQTICGITQALSGVVTKVMDEEHLYRTEGLPTPDHHRQVAVRLCGIVKVCSKVCSMGQLARAEPLSVEQDGASDGETLVSEGC